MLVACHSFLKNTDLILKELADHGIEVRVDVNDPGDAKIRLFLLDRETDLSDVFKFLETLSEFTGPTIVCGPKLTAKAKKALGDPRIIKPRDWTQHLMAERILGELFLFIEAEDNPMIGYSRAMKEMQRKINAYALSPDPILVQGEPGTGKELVVAAVSRASSTNGEYLPLNCAELTAEMMASEIFGHVKGAFTGAIANRKGLLESCSEGILFLDEIGEVTAENQAKLLRAVEYGEYRPVGSNIIMKSKARLIFATNRNLKQACETGLFRLDFLSRIEGLTIHTPPLRERMSDIPILVRHFVVEWNKDMKERGKQIKPPQSYDEFFKHTWPQNIRGLRGVVRQAATYTDHGLPLSQEILERRIGQLTDETPHQITGHTIDFDPSDRWENVNAQAWRAYASALIDLTGGNKIEAGKISGLSKSRFYEKIKEAGLD